VPKNNKIKIVLVGYKSFIQEKLYLRLRKKNKIKKLRFKDLNGDIINNHDLIINCSKRNLFFKKKYSKKNDRNLIISNLIKKNHIRLIILSTRQVYEPKLFITEKSNLKPMNIYAQNVLHSESLCKKKIGSNLLILRLSNVFGLEIGKKKRPSLTSIIINGFKKKKIIFDNNYMLYKDFLPVELLCKYIEKLIFKKASGIFNIGSGIPILVSDYVNKTVNLKKSKLIIKLKKNFVDKSFCFDITKLYKFTGIKINKNKLNSSFNDLRIRLNRNV